MTGRVPPPQRGTESELLLAFLDDQRAALGRRTSGLADEDLRRELPPAGLSLAGVMKHLAVLEDYWFSYVFAGNQVARTFSHVDWQAEPDWDWRSATEDEPAALRALHDATVVHSRSVVAGEELDADSVRANRRTGEKYSLRWIALHMLEEYGRHLGYAELLRESLGKPPAE